jgi:hypothetical protein
VKIAYFSPRRRSGNRRHHPVPVPDSVARRCDSRSVTADSGRPSSDGPMTPELAEESSPRRRSCSESADGVDVVTRPPREDDGAALGDLARRHGRLAGEGPALHGRSRRVLEHHLERHRPGQARVRLSLTDEVFLGSSTWVRVQLGIPLPEQHRCTQTCRGHPQGHLGVGLVDQERTSAGVRQRRQNLPRRLSAPFAERAAPCAWRACARSWCRACRAVRPNR